MARLILLVSLLISLHGLAKETTAQEPVKVDCEAIMKTGDMELIVKRGCCSHHQGVQQCTAHCPVHSASSIADKYRQNWLLKARSVLLRKGSIQ